MNVFIEDVITITKDIKDLNKKVDDIIIKINELYKYKEDKIREKKKRKLLNNFTYSSSDDSDCDCDDDNCSLKIKDIRKVDSECEDNCGCGKEPQKEDKEISNYLKRLMKKKEENDYDSCSSCGFDYRFDKSP